VTDAAIAAAGDIQATPTTVALEADLEVVRTEVESLSENGPRLLKPLLSLAQLRLSDLATSLVRGLAKRVVVSRLQLSEPEVLMVLSIVILTPSRSATWLKQSSVVSQPIV